MHRLALRSALPLAAHGSLLAQGAVAAPGFAGTVAFADTIHAAAIHRVAAVGDGRHVVAWQDALYETHGAFDPADRARSRLLLRASEPIGFVDTDGTDVLAGGLRSGRIVRIDLATRAVALHAAGVANAFDAARLGNGDLLLAANPTWPASGAHAGIWLAGPGRMPRELLALTGPSGPLAVDTAGDLVAAEIDLTGPGSARLLRVPAVRLQQAIAGATLTMADVGAVGGGHAVVHDLVTAPDGRVFVSHAASSSVRATAPGSLAPAAAWFDAGPGRFATTLQWLPGGPAPFRGWVPPAHAPALCVTTGDFAAALDVVRVAPHRPEGAIAPSAQLAPGTSTLQLRAGPANGLVAWLASLPAGPLELPVLAPGGTPLWLGLDLPSSVPLAAAALDASGSAACALANPGGAAFACTAQAVVLGPQPGEVGSCAPLALQFLP